MLSDPVVTIECDECGDMKEYGLTPLARGSYDERNVRGEAERDGWWFDPDGDDHHLCGDCRANEDAENARAEDAEK